MTEAEAGAVAQVLADAGITLIEIPSTRRSRSHPSMQATQALAGQAVIGAGTVLLPSEVDAPGIFSPTEAFRAIRPVQARLRCFRRVVGARGIKAVGIYAVGGRQAGKLCRVLLGRLHRLRHRQLSLQAADAVRYSRTRASDRWRLRSGD
jgi:2-keto-3-deoxy-6-phosphogluconate aldolase